MIQKTKTAAGVLLEDDESGESLQLGWEDVGELLHLVSDELAQVAALVDRAERPAETLARVIGSAVVAASIDEAASSGR